MEYHDFENISFESEDLNEASFGNINLYGECTIYVYGNEGPIPHFHIVKRGFPDCCVCLHTNKYFKHGSKVSILNSKNKRILNTYLEKPYSKTDNKKTVWEAMCEYWNAVNTQYKQQFPKTQPDYNTMKDTIVGQM